MQLQQLQDVAVGVAESGDPAAPMFLLRQADELHARRLQPPEFGVNVVHAQMRHQAERVGGRPPHLAVAAEVEPQFA